MLLCTEKDFDNLSGCDIRSDVAKNGARRLVLNPVVLWSSRPCTLKSGVVSESEPIHMQRVGAGIKF